MAEIKNKAVTVESLSALHEYNNGTYATKKENNNKINLNDGWNFSNIGTSIPSNSDLNDYTIAGNYYCGFAAIAQTVANAPITNAGFRLLVMNGYVEKRIHQIAILGGNQILMRTSNYDSNNNYIWSNWIRPLTNILTSEDYGDTLPEAGTVGRIFFKKLVE